MREGEGEENRLCGETLDESGGVERGGEIEEEFHGECVWEDSETVGEVGGSKHIGTSTVRKG